MYEVHHRRYLNSIQDYALIAVQCKTLKEALYNRAVSGDLVVCSVTHRIVDSTEWLFDWEKDDPKCYAQKALRYTRES